MGCVHRFGRCTAVLVPDALLRQGLLAGLLNMRAQEVANSMNTAW